MVTKLKCILLICLAMLLCSCPKGIRVDYTGKAIPIKLSYKTPFKVGDTLWLSTTYNQSDFVDGNNKLIRALSTYSTTGGGGEGISYKMDNDKYTLDSIGEYIYKNGFSRTNPLSYDPITKNYEYQIGFIPNKKGIYSIWSYDIGISKITKSMIYSWTLPTYFEGDRPEDRKQGKEIVVE